MSVNQSDEAQGQEEPLIVSSLNDVELTAEDRARHNINTATDTPTLFEAGNGLLGFQAHPIVGIVNLAFCAFVASVRHTTEVIKSAENKNMQLEKGQFNWSQFFNNMAAFNKEGLRKDYYAFAGNLGASLEASGGILMTTALLGAAASVFVGGITLWPLAVLGTFGAANFARGFAMRLDEESNGRKVLDTVGIALAAAGCMMAAPGSPLAVKCGFAAAALLEATRSLTGKYPANGMADLTFAAALVGNALYSPNALTSVANAIFAGAFVSLSALKTNGGVYEAVSNIKNRFFPKPEI